MKSSKQILNRYQSSGNANTGKSQNTIEDLSLTKFALLPIFTCSNNDYQETSNFNLHGNN